MIRRLMMTQILSSHKQNKAISSNIEVSILVLYDTSVRRGKLQTCDTPQRLMRELILLYFNLRGRWRPPRALKTFLMIVLETGWRYYTSMKLLDSSALLWYSHSSDPSCCAVFGSWAREPYLWNHLVPSPVQHSQWMWRYCTKNWRLYLEACG